MDQVKISWTDDTGTFENTFTWESPTLPEVKAAYGGSLMTPVPKTETDAEFYAGLSLQMVNQVAGFAQQYKQQQAIATVPAISVKEAV